MTREFNIHNRWRNDSEMLNITARKMTAKAILFGAVHGIKKETKQRQEKEILSFYDRIVSDIQIGKKISIDQPVQLLFCILPLFIFLKDDCNFNYYLNKLKQYVNINDEKNIKSSYFFFLILFYLYNCYNVDAAIKMSIQKYEEQLSPVSTDEVINFNKEVTFESYSSFKSNINSVFQRIFNVYKTPKTEKDAIEFINDIFNKESPVIGCLIGGIIGIQWRKTFSELLPPNQEILEKIEQFVSFACGGIE